MFHASAVLLRPLYHSISIVLSQVMPKQITVSKPMPNMSSYQKPIAKTVSTLALSVILTTGLVACDKPEPATTPQQQAKLSQLTNLPTTPSNETQTHIDEFAPKYVEIMQQLQNRLQKEYDSKIKQQNTASASGNDNASKPVTIKPIMKDETTLEKDYRNAIKELYNNKIPDLSANSVNTLINLATLLPASLEEADIAMRLDLKNPALARLMAQYHIWQTIEDRQSKDIKRLKAEQEQANIKRKQELEEITTEFSKTIENYDKQISKYEKKLKEFK